MTTARWDNTHSGRMHEVYLVHPGTHDTYRARVEVSRRGLTLCRVPDHPSRTGRAGKALRVPWWSVQGFSADGTDEDPDANLVQVVEVVTDDGTLSLLAPAAEVSVLMEDVARWSGRWNRSRQPLMVVAGKVAAAGLVVVRPFGRAGRSVGHALATFGWAVALCISIALRVLMAPFRAVLRPIGRLVARATAPFRRRVAGSFLGLAAATAWRRARSPLGRSKEDRVRSAPVIRPVFALVLLVVVVAGGVFFAAGGGPQDSGAAPPPKPAANGGNPDAAQMARMLQGERQEHAPINLPKAAAPPAPAPPTLASQPPLSPHEVFGFAPYWTLTQSTGFDVGGMTTIAYFSIGVNANGTLDESGSGWDGYESQDLANLVTRAHAAGVRVVLAVNDFDQSSLDQLTSSPTAPATLSSALLQAIEAKNLDGVNLDFEGEGSSDQAGLTNLVTKVSAAIHGANPHYQVTMDTYASSAGDPNGFYNIPALAPAVDAFFVMAYQLNLQGSSTPASPLTSSMFSDLTTAQQYADAVSPSKVILGVPYYGYSWPTSNGTMSAQATGGANPISYAQIVAQGSPTYWDPVTDTAWTSYQQNGQWYEDYFEDPSSLYLIAQLSQTYGLGGLGIWALGMDGNDPQMLAALDGFAPATKGTLAGPTSTPPSSSPAAGAASPTPSTPTTTSQPAAPGSSSPASGGSQETGGSSPTTTAPPQSTTPTGGGGGGGSPTPSPTYHYTGTWQGQQVTLTLLTTPQVPTSGAPVLLGKLTGFQTTNPSLSCLTSASDLYVWKLGTAPTHYVVMAEKPVDCTTAEFTFPVPASSPSPGTTGSAASTTTTTTAGSESPAVIAAPSAGTTGGTTPVASTAPASKPTA